tara:strand:+ start:506 stop:808 length:303 start_codon:yes stop_codon:yes gene_type:complete
MLQAFYIYFTPDDEIYSIQIAQWYYDPQYKNIFDNLSKRELIIIKEEIIGMENGCYSNFEDLKPKMISEIKNPSRRSEASKIYFKLKNKIDKINDCTHNP